MIIIKEFDFDAAHYLPAYNGKCEHLHGHTYKLVVKVEGTPDHEGMVIDFIKLKNLVKQEVLSKLDHACLNDILPVPSGSPADRRSPCQKSAGCPAYIAHQHKSCAPSS